MFKVAVIEDDPEIGSLIERRVNKTEIVICSGVYAGPLTYIQSGSKDDIVLLDILMPEMNGVEAIPLLLEHNPGQLIIMNSIKSSSDLIFNSIKAGAIGYLDKQSTTVDYVEVFTSVLNGGAYLTPSVAFKIVKHFSSKQNNDTILTERERKVAQKIKEGKTYSVIGDEMSISVNTVRMHIKNIYKKLQINSKYELMHLNKM
jgi:DNA-binding NarL/FixJ family response regulator